MRRNHFEKIALQIGITKEHSKGTQPNDLRKEKLNEYHREYRKKNDEKLKLYYRDYMIQNKEKKMQYNLKYKLKHNEKVLEYERTYRLLKKLKKKDYNREYRLKNGDKLRELARMTNIMKKIQKNSNFIPPPKLKSWKSIESLRNYFESTSRTLHITELSDWYRVSRNQIHETGGIYLLFTFYSDLFIVNFLYAYYSHFIIIL